ncbi:hypothetical protein STPH2_1585 [Streptomyces sp. KO7888]|uniref:hypothetical protein n=1 Tax=Streptomyces sp. KO7888 TaxID=2602737 RepID=UPI001A03B90F|nr:hypothetical protein [Streptomyces sp. KO7888]
MEQRHGRSAHAARGPALADALYAPFDPADNLARMTFLDPVGRSFKTQDAKHLLHPDVGPLTLTYQAFVPRPARFPPLHPAPPRPPP